MPSLIKKYKDKEMFNIEFPDLSSILDYFKIPYKNISGEFPSTTVTQLNISSMLDLENKILCEISIQEKGKIILDDKIYSIVQFEHFLKTRINKNIKIIYGLKINNYSKEELKKFCDDPWNIPSQTCFEGVIAFKILRRREEN